MAASAGHQIEFHEPDKNAEAIYDYLDKDCKLLKQVLRYEKAGEPKTFTQRRPVPGGWVWDTEGVPRSLYNLHKLQDARTVCICEGEKDCDTVTALSLRDRDDAKVLGVTSGGSDSWKDELADDLRGKTVVLMPDADDAGKRFATDVAASLDVRGIGYRTVLFEGKDIKDVSDFLAAGHTAEEIVERIGTDWILLPGGVPRAQESELIIP